MSIDNWKVSQTSDLTGKTYFITGTNLWTLSQGLLGVSWIID